VIEICVLAAVLTITGAVIGVLAVVSLGIHREERAFSLTTPTLDRAGVIQQAGLHRQDFLLADREVKG
jgi:hypothetical protein